jgi:3D (Asp-Asp-Asp) domain-containing protein
VVVKSQGIMYDGIYLIEQWCPTETSRRVYTKVIRVQESHFVPGGNYGSAFVFDTTGACMQNVDLGRVE